MNRFHRHFLLFEAQPDAGGGAAPPADPAAGAPDPGPQFQPPAPTPAADPNDPQFQPPAAPPAAADPITGIDPTEWANVRDAAMGLHQLVQQEAGRGQQQQQPQGGPLAGFDADSFDPYDVRQQLALLQAAVAPMLQEAIGPMRPLMTTVAQTEGERRAMEGFGQLEREIGGFDKRHALDLTKTLLDEGYEGADALREAATRTRSLQVESFQAGVKAARDAMTNGGGQPAAPALGGGGAQPAPDTHDLNVRPTQSSRKAYRDAGVTSIERLRARRAEVQ